MGGTGIITDGQSADGWHVASTNGPWIVPNDAAVYKPAAKVHAEPSTSKFQRLGWISQKIDLSVQISTRSESEMDQIDDLVLGFGKSACRGSK